MRKPFQNLRLLWSQQDIVSKCVIAGTLVLIVFAYLPTLQFDYATQDQWRAFRYATFGGSALSRATSCITTIPTFYTQTGRPLVWLGECIEHAAVYRISDFVYLRPFVLAVVLVTVIELGRTLAPWVGGLAVGMAAAAAFVVSPGYSFMYLQSMPALMVLIALLLAAISYRFCSERQHGGKRYIAMAAGLFFLACLMYPAYAFCVVTIALIEFGSDTSIDLNERIKKLCMTLAIYSICTTLYFIFVKASVAILTVIEGPLPPLNFSYYDVTPHFAPGTLLHRISDVIHYLYFMPPLNFVTPHGVNFGIILAFSCGTAWLTTWPRQRSIRAFLVVSILNFSATAILLIGAISPFLVSQFPSIATRQALPFYLFFCAASFGLLNAFLKMFIGSTTRWAPLAVAGCLLFPVILIQNRLSFIEIAVTNAEIDDIRLSIAQWVRDHGWVNDRSILIVLPHVQRPAPIEQMVNNTGYGNENSVLALSHNPVTVPWMLNAILREQPTIPHNFSLYNCTDDEICTLVHLPDDNDIILNYTFGMTPIHTYTMPFIINLSLLTSAPVTPDIIVTNMSTMPSITVSSQLQDLGPGGLLFAEEPGWHAARNPTYPQTVTIDFKKIRTFRSLDILPQDNSEIRMPKSVIIFTGTDGQSWSKVTSAQDICSTVASDGWHDVKFPAAVSARYLKLEILSNCGPSDLLTIRGLRPG